MNSIFIIVNTIAIILGFCLGMIFQKLNLCLVGAIKKSLEGTFNQISIYLTAVASSIIIVQLSILLFNLNFTETLFLTSQLNWKYNLLGGAIFGVGAVLAGGCPSRQLIFLSRGQIISLFVLLIMGFFTYLSALNISLENGYQQNLTSVLANTFFIKQPAIQIFISLSLVTLLFLLRKKINLFWLGVIIGLIVASGWITTKIGAFLNPIINEQSFSFTSPFGNLVKFFINPDFEFIDFSFICASGYFLGCLFFVWKNKIFSYFLETNFITLIKKFSGAVLMGSGIGCTIGQGISGISLLSLSALISFFASCFSIFFIFYLKLFFAKNN